MKDHKNKVLRYPPKHERPDYIISAIFSVIILLLSFQTRSDAAETKKILVLHSYHQGLAWTDELMEGIYSVFNEYDPKLELHVEYMDTKRYFDGLQGKYLTRLRDMYKDKYSGTKLDMIISSDDDAFQFLLMYHDELFPGTPIVFCGVNHFEDAMLSGQDLITGVIELLDTKASIDIALKLHPETDQLVIITDTTTSGKENRLRLEQLAEKYKGKAGFVFIDKDNTGLTLQELLDRLRPLKKGSVVFYSDFLRNRGEYIIQEMAVPQISAVSDRPVYTHYDEILGLGVVGGKLINGKSHGRKAAQMALQILQGTPVSNLPVYKESTNSYMFDYKQLTRFGINENALPEGSLVINRPFSFYSQYKQLVWTVSGIITLLVISLITISINIIKRKKAEVKLKNAYDTLELKVEERTIDLSKANLALNSEITERKKMEQRLQEMTITDELTGLLNRRGFFTLAEQQRKLSDRTGKRMSLLYIDVDGLKTINDQLGHEAGDQALIDAANLLRKSFRESDIIARIGGDEFIVLLTAPSEPDMENIAVGHVTNNLTIHNEQSGRNYTLIFSMGIAHYDPERPCALSELLTRADALMYEDKKRHRLEKPSC